MTSEDRTRPVPQNGAFLNGTPRDADAPTVAEAPGRDPWGGWWLHAVRHLGRDYGLILPGAVISTFAFTVLVALVPVSAALLVVWVGVVLLSSTLVIAGWFAELSRARVRAWGADLPRPAYRDPGRGPGSLMRIAVDGRRWLDLVFETVVAFPLRLVSFVVTVVWSSVALGATTYFAWGRTDPGSHSGVGEALRWLTRGAIPASVGGSFPVTAAVYFLIGMVFLATLPVVVHGLALLEAVAVRAGLGGAPQDGMDPSSAGTVPDGAPAGNPGASLLRRPGSEGWAWLAAAVVAVALLAIDWPVLAAAYGVHPAIAMALALGQSAAVLVAVRWWWAGSDWRRRRRSALRWRRPRHRGCPGRGRSRP